VGNFHGIACECNGKRVGTVSLWDRQELGRKGAGWSLSLSARPACESLI
jgi:hypothetical protein